MRSIGLFLPFAALLCLLPLTVAARPTITKGPVLQRPTADSIMVTWEQDIPSAPSIRYGVSSQSLQTLPSAGSATRHEVTLSGLDPDTEYLYFISDEGMAISDSHRFLTMPLEGTAFSFVVMGDTRSDPAAHHNTIAALSGLDIRFAVNSGDLVADGEIDEQWTTFFDIERPLLAKVPLFPVIGNHETDDGEVDLFLKYFVNPESTSGKEQYYSVDYANVHLTVLDGHSEVDEWYTCSLRGLLTDDCFTQEQEDWLRYDIEQAHLNPAIDHILVFVHAGPYTSVADRTGNAHMRQLMDFFGEQGVTAIISGHDHYYERGVSGNGIPYIISGGGGAPLYEIEKPCMFPHTVHHNLKDYHYLYITVAGDYLNIESRRVDGELFDGLEIGTRPECLTNADCIPEEMPYCGETAARCNAFFCYTECLDEPIPDDTMPTDDTAATDDNGTANDDAAAVDTDTATTDIETTPDTATASDADHAATMNDDDPGNGIIEESPTGCACAAIL